MKNTRDIDEATKKNRVELQVGKMNEKKKLWVVKICVGCTSIKNKENMQMRQPRARYTLFSLYHSTSMA